MLKDDFLNTRNFLIIILLISDACKRLYKGIPNGPNTYCCDPKCGKGHPKGKGCGGAGCSKNGDECCSGDFVNQACKNKKRAPCRNP